ncbi:hypothetical protein [Bradyrhizobium yuanmingense]|uniref:hypothetical protein n=1 Tax=Bradyrhizobium yuanmingense TaxID=108015 RepID=UPI0004AEFF69
MTVLELKAQHDALQKIATTRDPIRALAEFVWNALDADATSVSVELNRNPLGGSMLSPYATTETASAGHGRWKISRTSELRGREAASGLASTGYCTGKRGKAGCASSRLRSGRVGGASIGTAIRYASYRFKSRPTRSTSPRFTEIDLADSDDATGTIVELNPLKETFDWLTGEEARTDFAAVFAPYILQYPDVVITFDGHTVDPSATVAHSKEFPAHSVICPTRVIKDLSIKVIEWKHSVGGRKIHLGGQSGVVLGSLPANVTAPGFEFSAYAYAPFFQEIADANLLEFDGLNDVDFIKVIDHIRDQLGDYFRARQAERSSELIQELKNAGVYPYEGDPKDEVEKRERQVLDIAIHAVSSYSRDFKRAENPLKKITLGLLREAVRHNPEGIHNILHHVFNLPKNRQDEFSSLLQKTNLGNIISASTLIADRVVALEVLKSIVFNPTHRRTVKERGELDVLVQANTWIFGENFHITLAEAGLSRVMQRVSEELTGHKGKQKITKPDGSSGRVDSFLGRIVPHQDQLHREFLLIELKRPSLKIGRKETDQLEDYVNAVRKQPDFNSTSTYWNFFLVTGEYEDDVGERITQQGRPSGVLIQKETHVVWVKTWSQLIRECEARLHFIAEKLQVEVTDEFIEERIAQLKSSILKEEPKTLDQAAAASNPSHAEPKSTRASDAAAPPG